MKRSMTLTINLHRIDVVATFMSDDVNLMAGKIFNLPDTLVGMKNTLKQLYKLAERVDSWEIEDPDRNEEFFSASDEDSGIMWAICHSEIPKGDLHEEIRNVLLSYLYSAICEEPNLHKFRARIKEFLTKIEEAEGKHGKLK